MNVINEVRSMLESVDNISMEADSTVAVEQEMVFYCQITDLDALKAASKLTIDQEQWEVKSPTAKGRFRVRVEHYNDGDGPRTEYECTVKTKRAEGGDTEVNQPVDEAFFEAVKGIATNGMRKTRYVVSVFDNGDINDANTYKWEFDVYAGTDWCKVDLELPTNGNRVRMSSESFMAKLGNLPYVKNVIRDEGDNKAVIRDLYEKYFIITNPTVSAESLIEIYGDLGFFTENEMRERARLFHARLKTNSESSSMEGLGAALDKLLFGTLPPSLEEDKAAFKFIENNLKNAGGFKVKGKPIPAKFFAAGFYKNGTLPTNLVSEITKNANTIISDVRTHFKIVANYDAMCEKLVGLLKTSNGKNTKELERSVLELLTQLRNHVPATAVYAKFGPKSYLGDVKLVDKDIYSPHTTINYTTHNPSLAQKDSQNRRNKATVPALTVDEIKSLLGVCGNLAQCLADVRVTYKPAIDASSDEHQSYRVCGKVGKSMGKLYFTHLDKTTWNVVYSYLEHFGKAHMTNAEIEAEVSQNHWMDIMGHLGEDANINLFEERYLEEQLVYIARYIQASIEKQG